MNAKKLKKQVKTLQHDVDILTSRVLKLSDTISEHHCYCENYKPRTVTLRRYVPLPKIDTTTGE